MKRKHWQGYGTVNARVIERNIHKILIKVEGDHEYGLAINQGDNYTLAKWLGTKSLGNFTVEDVQSFSIQHMSDTDCIYTIKLKAH
jgi:hypothetical protein